MDNAKPKGLVLSSIILALAAGAMIGANLMQPSQLPAYKPVTEVTVEVPPSAVPTSPTTMPSPTPYVHKPPTTGGPLPSSTSSLDGGNTGGNAPSPLPVASHPTPKSKSPSN